MTWSRTEAVAGLYAALAAQLGETTWVFDKPPQTLNPPAVVIGRPTEVVYSQPAFGVDEATVSVICVGAADGEDAVDGLITAVRSAVSADITLGGAVQHCDDTREQNWRIVNVAGTDVLQAEVVLTIRM